MAGEVRVNRRLVIPSGELELKFTPSGGPGGQHANRSSTRVELVWNVDDSVVLGPRQRARIKQHLGRRIDSEGALHLASSTYRSQTRNRADVLARLATLVGDALTPEKRRLATRPTKQSQERRLQEKKRRSEKKRLRRAPPD